MTEYTLYSEATGRIRQAGDTSDDPMQKPRLSGELVHIGGKYLGATHYFLNGQPTERPSLDLAAAIAAASAAGDILSATGLPAGAPVELERPEGAPAAGVIAANGTLEIAFPDAGRFTLRIAPPFPWLPFEAVIEIGKAP